MQQWVVGAVGTIAALLVAIGISWFGSDGGVIIAGIPLFAVCGLMAYLVQWLAFIHAWRTHSEAYFDLIGSFTFIAVAITAVTLAGRLDVRSILLAVLIVLWALRLGPFLFQRIKRAGEDKRFRTIKHSFPTFLMTWTIQGTWVFVTASCALAAITSGVSAAVDAPLLLGLAVWLFGFTVEVVADRQKTAFRKNPQNAQSFITTGLWAWSRHPNYFGEIILWVGIAIVAYPALQGMQVFTLFSPLFVVVLLTTISGVRMLEARANKQWADDPAYQAYKRHTPMLMLWPPRARH
jgi:steroid 5-alpha reductase family enzyme